MKVSLPLMVLVTVLSLSSPVFSQSGETKVEFQKGDKVSAIIELPYTARVVEDAVPYLVDRNGFGPDGDTQDGDDHQHADGGDEPRRSCGLPPSRCRGGLCCFGGTVNQHGS